ncbi:hypothetical protein CH373_16230 [Leptospira perolatii]|uniref:Histidine kinase n=1 Tax=Leptospira perolatii TaxID=2023191 RepID=A0A2M9ZIX6_9LEPT|nr:response regulator [Leptospira perolatii]PJZ69493.1 hypothetical protein CH360_10830 [Leptospira perolatii]PJZ72008.1 hypothetical protein CH373_16230 [Leptospira perolatii]
MVTTKIMIVEDEGLVAQDLKRRLSKMGYSTFHVVNTGESAVKQSRIFQPDLILMDIILAQGFMDGIDAAKQIREFLDTPIIFLTASSDTRTLVRAKATEPDGYILKPFQTRELQITIELTLYKHESEKETRRKDKWLRTALDSLSEGVIASDTSGNICFMNGVAQQFTGWKEMEACGKPMAEIVRFARPFFREPNETNSENGLESMNEIYSEGLVLSKDGNITKVFAKNEPVLSTNGVRLGSILVLRDS